MKIKTRDIAVSALLAALVFVATRFVQIPMGPIGYVNMGDGIVILAGWMLPPGFAFIAAGIGSALADVLSPYVIYAPATFVIKGAMALIVCLIFKALKKKNTLLPSSIGSVLSEITMVLGYLLYEGVMYGFKTAVLSVPFNCVQGAVGIVIGVILVKILSKVKIFNQ